MKQRMNNMAKKPATSGQKQPGTIAEHLAKFAKDGKSYGYIQGKINSISEKDITSKTSGEAFHIHTYNISDGTSYGDEDSGEVVDSIDLAIFRDPDEADPFKEGETLSATDLIAKEFMNVVQLSTTKASKVTKKTGGGTAKPAAKPAAKPIASKTGTPSSTSGSGSGSSGDVKKAIQHMESAIVTKLDEMQQALIKQQKEVIKGLVGPKKTEADSEDEQEPEEDQEDESEGESESEDGETEDGSENQEETS